MLTASAALRMGEEGGVSTKETGAGRVTGRVPHWGLERVDPGSRQRRTGAAIPLSPDIGALLQAPYFWPSNCWEPENTDYGEQ